MDLVTQGIINMSIVLIIGVVGNIIMVCLGVKALRCKTSGEEGFKKLSEAYVCRTLGIKNQNKYRHDDNKYRYNQYDKEQYRKYKYEKNCTYNLRKEF